MNERKTLAQTKQSQFRNGAFHFSFNFDRFNLLKSTERTSAHLKCLCLCTCSLEKLWIQQGFSCYPFYFHHSGICKHRPFRTPTAMTVLPAAQDLLVFWRPSGQTKRSARESPLTATEVPDLRARLCMLLSCWLRAHRVKPLSAVSTKSKQRHQNREWQFERPLHTNHPLQEVYKLHQCTSDTLGTWHSLLSLLGQLSAVNVQKRDQPPVQFFPFWLLESVQHTLLMIFDIQQHNRTGRSWKHSYLFFLSSFFWWRSRQRDGRMFSCELGDASLVLQHWITPQASHPQLAHTPTF